MRVGIRIRDVELMCGGQPADAIISGFTGLVVAAWNGAATYGRLPVMSFQ